MTAVPSRSADASRHGRLLVLGILGLALALRLAHISGAFQSPLHFQPGPDEEYYQGFGAAVAAGDGAADSAEFTFMDPGYGYLLGAVFKLFGVNLFAVYVLQALVDTATVYAVLVAGRLLGRPRAGLVAASLYALTSTAIMFCAATLKEVWVAGFLAWWIVGALALWRSDRRVAWVAFGVWCGLGVALRSTLAAFVLPALLLAVLPADGDRNRDGKTGTRTGTRDDVSREASALPRRRRQRFMSCALFMGGMVLSLLPWSLRNIHAYGSLSPLPHNGGIVLHQLYNADNPRATLWIPAFVNYSNPSDIWRGYAAEAERRAGHALSPRDVDGYWRDEALAFMQSHPRAVLTAVLTKSLMFLADTEVPNNRSSAEERLFSPVLAALPTPAAWLLSLGLAGLTCLILQDRRWPVVAAPIAMAWLTMAVFWAEDRFRFHALPALALCSGIFIDQLLRWRLPRAHRYGVVGHDVGGDGVVGDLAVGHGVFGVGGVRNGMVDHGADRDDRVDGGAVRDGVAPHRGPSPARRAAGGLPAACLLAVLVGAASLWLGRQFPPPALRWDHVVWGYIKMGKLAAANTLAARIAREQPDNGPIIEALGYLAASSQRYEDALGDYQRAVLLRPRSYLARYNLAKTLLVLGRRSDAAVQARIAVDLQPSDEALALLKEAEATP